VKSLSPKAAVLGDRGIEHERCRGFVLGRTHSWGARKGNTSSYRRAPKQAASANKDAQAGKDGVIWIAKLVKVNCPVC
jgi:hypothetical protein